MSKVPLDESAPGRLGSRPVHDGRIVKLSVDTVRFPDGSVGELEMIRHPGAAAVMPVVGSLEADDPRVLLLRQYRYASGGYLYEVPAGLPDGPDEDWDTCARRELEEETGHRAGSLQPLTAIYTTPGFTDEVIRLYLATHLSPGASNLDEDEFVEVLTVPFSEVLEMVRRGEIVDCKSVATILFVAQFVLRQDGPGDA
jgi:ADP-ribose pyrophosphatase